MEVKANEALSLEPDNKRFLWKSSFSSQKIYFDAQGRDFLG